MKYDFDDILIQPKITSSINTRTIEINPLYSNGFLPLITAPMDTVINAKNAEKFTELGIIPCFPRGEEETYISDNFYFYSYGLNEFNECLKNEKLSPNGKYLIDIANGHMLKLLEIVLKTKEKYPNMTLMVGNIANPETYKLLSNAGADFIRIGIGNGNGCLTTEHTGVGYPIASLIKECYDISRTIERPAKIVADGGMKKYSDIIKSLALGADYVMIGSIFNKSLESAGFNYLWNKIKVSQNTAEWLYKHKFPIYKKFRGMSTKAVQKKWGAREIKTSEGVIRFRKVEYTLDKWTENFIHYLKTAMSYTNAKTLSEFIGKPEINIVSENAYRRFNK